MPRTRAVVVFAVSAYVLLLVAIYVLVIARRFAYTGDVYHSPGQLLFLSALVWAIAPALWLKTSVNRPSLAVFWVLYLLAYVPAQIVPYFTLRPASRAFPWSITLFIAFALMSLIIRRAPARRFLPVGSSVPLWALISAFLFLAYALGSHYGLRLEDPNLAETYVSRFQYRNALLLGGGGLAYLVAWTGNVINPLLMSYGLIKRKFALLALGGLGQVALFSLTGFKSMLFSPLFVVLLHFAARDEGRFFARRVVSSIGGIIALGLTASLMLRDDFITYVFVRRVLVTPGLLSGAYLDFFSTHPKTLFAESLPGGLVHNPYGTSPAFIIGRAFFHNTQTGANANIFASGYAGLGWLGVILVAVLAAFYLRFLDAVTAGRDWRLLLGVIGMMAFTLANSSLLTALQTHGLAFACLLILLLPATASSSEGRAKSGGSSHSGIDPYHATSHSWRKVRLSASATSSQTAWQPQPANGEATRGWKRQFLRTSPVDGGP